MGGERLLGLGGLVVGGGDEGRHFEGVLRGLDGVCSVFGG